MNGRETKQDLERCTVWDSVFERGPSTIAKLAERTELGRARVTALVDHDWFRQQDGHIYIAIVAANGVKGIRLPKTVAA